jgi:hypothetical protein
MVFFNGLISESKGMMTSSAGCGTRCGAGVVLSEEAAPPSPDSCCSEILKVSIISDDFLVVLSRLGSTVRAGSLCWDHILSSWKKNGLG